jgi:hypothetical protein
MHVTIAQLGRSVGGMARRTRGILGAFALALAVLAPIAFAVDGSPYGSAAANEAAARAAAPQLLALLRLPPDATPSSSEPAGDGGALAQTGYEAATPNEVDAHAYWTLAGPEVAILAYLKARLPRDARAAGTSESSGGGQPTVNSYLWSLPALPGVLATRTLVLTMVGLSGGGVAARTDGVAIWLTPRPSWERIPAAVRSVTFTGRGADARGRPQRASAPVTLRGVRARRLVSFIDELPIVQPGAEACPAALPISLALRFSGTSGRMLARAVEQPTGCASVSLRIAERRGPALQDDPSVTDELIRLGAIRTCAGGALTASAQGPGRDGPAASRGMSLMLLNHSRQVCRLQGFPRLHLSGAGGRTIPVHVSHPDAADIRRQGIAADAVLDPGTAASLFLRWRTCGARAGTRLDFAMPGVAGGFTAPVPGGIAPCGGRLVAGSIEPNP